MNFDNYLKKILKKMKLFMRIIIVCQKKGMLSVYTLLEKSLTREEFFLVLIF